MKEIIVKDNALINASYNLDLVEQRLILLAIIEARETGKGINANDALEVHASSYINHFNVEKHTAYTVLKQAADDLFERRFSYQFTNTNGNNEYVKSRWVSEIRYVENEALIKLIFAPSVVPLITRLEQHFTSYELKQVRQLSSRYAIRLYELLIAWRSTGKTPIFELTEFRNQLGIADDEYKRMELFKRRVLEVAISQVNDFTDIVVKYEQHKKGRTISGFSFDFKQKQERKKIDIKKSVLSDKQLDLFANKLAYDSAFSSQFSEPGESYDNFAKRIKEQLKDPVNLDKYLEYLDSLGLKL
ncbi:MULTISPECIES: replication initiation protein RepM [Acinetobacter]|jgi:plasmid replication initiation protein|uniref:replication initiation protein RepM n=1 Tax=Acinetobacter TaxID=469 RepID=UPI000C3AF73A|nr:MULTISPECIES: replication initiation protein RepM [Acinetobacter]MBT50050.1 RepB family plasmid replication initiator protein [Acinetobacter sp.]MBT51801.1 RepB family plasmid replication initiator protein [Acinetobacter sp.]HAV4511723.1 RepB family plasmid replication initiator protein [Acinetobacter baumannii]|tara:strand:+ start:104 stop:1009 length:906 start_codon:yes stop_codon:yes gene_type:complete